MKVQTVAKFRGASVSGDSLKVEIEVSHDSCASYRRSVYPAAWREFLRFAETSAGRETLSGYDCKEVLQEGILAGGDSASVIVYTLTVNTKK